MTRKYTFTSIDVLVLSKYFIPQRDTFINTLKRRVLTKRDQWFCIMISYSAMRKIYKWWADSLHLEKSWSSIIIRFVIWAVFQSHGTFHFRRKNTNHTCYLRPPWFSCGPASNSKCGLPEGSSVGSEDCWYLETAAELCQAPTPAPSISCAM